MKNSLHRLTGFASIATVICLLVAGSTDAPRAASKNVDLDKNGSNESIVDLTVISSYPAKVKCKITNKAPGYSYSFRWPSAGPGGFSSTLATGKSTGVGTVWDWQTGQAIYSYTGSICDKDICFTPTAWPTTDPGARGPFSVPGRSLSPTDVTYSSASLTSSLISFFSPPQTEVSVTSSFGPTANEGLVFQNDYTNKTPFDVSLDFAPAPEGCCFEPNQVQCGESCANYLEDENNCGACGTVCGAGETCSNGDCIPVCGASQLLCADGANNPVCANYLTDPANCGGCGGTDPRFVCGAGGSCAGGACVYGVALGGYVPGIPTSPAPECVFDGFSSDLGPSESLTKWSCSPDLLKATEAETSLTVVSPVDENRDGSADLDENGTAKIKVSTGTFIELVPSSVPIGDVSPSIAFVELVQEPSGDGLLQPGETGTFRVTVNNIGPQELHGITGTLSAPPFNAADFAEAGIIVDPMPDLTVSPVPVPYPNLGRYAPSQCDASGINFYPDPMNPSAPVPPPIDRSLLPTSTNSTLFQVTIPSGHPGDVARKFNLRLSGLVNGNINARFDGDIPFAIGIAGKCDPTTNNGDYDQIDGLYTPMAKLVPADEGYTIPYPSKPFSAGKTRPMKLRQLCGGVELLGNQIVAPEIVKLTKKVGNGPRVDVPLSDVINEDTGTADPFFRFSDTGKQWIYNLRTTNLGPGDYIITIEIADEKNYLSGFVLQ
jgi:hypothetical protein